ncbi:MAG: 50S ribosomal protein L11 [Mycoplasmataceae bacterium]|nr:50S ribosomal protein L11 [Mycoplasmataceae bacterium]
MLVAAKKTITRIAKIQLIGGQAKPGPALASIGINMAEFTRQFNDKTKDRMGEVVPCVITAFNDKSFTFIIKTSPASVMLKKAAKIETAGKNQLTDHVATISKEKALEIAKYKLPDLNAYDDETALRMIGGTAKQMGITIEGVDLTPKKNAKAKKEAK